MIVSRRMLLAGASALSFAGLAAGWTKPARADDAPTATPAAPEAAAPPATVDLDDLLKADKLPEIVKGDDTAPITIVEYHSLTCPHCAHFHQTVLPTLEDKYIKTGKVRLILRGFPLNQLDAVAFMLLRCQPQENYLENVKLFYKDQQEWAYSDKPKEAILAMSKKIGFTQETFDACLNNEAVWDGLVSVAKKAAETFKVDGTPAFFINGKSAGSIASVDELETKLAPFLKN